ncbi:MAG TPA: L-aspartate oxidase [Syntrophomonas wolfei]|uniref:L-aspartate oxidase n=1 Tax=Syntrophomonas wolfei TaxID=863 RepID=A0A354YWJ4_9FIRM|nr:L-aspartate oxidase [Syntrophomonas wolfei]
MIITRYIGVLHKDTPVETTDFLIVGGGIAGLFTALKASQYGKVIVLTKKTIEDSNTGLAQGGIAAAVHEEDSPFLHLEDTLEAGAGLCNIEAVDLLVREGPERVRELIQAGASFDMKDGNVALTREGAHSKARILHAADTTGEAIRVALVKKCEESSDIRIIEDQFLVDILGHDQRKECYGALVYDAKTRQQLAYLAKATIIATGGAGQLYRYTTNPSVATADGMAAAYRAGCRLSDMEFIQFHPTVLFSYSNQRFLISEAVRGEGGLLYNHKGERSMPAYHSLAELAPRDIVSRAIVNEMNCSGSEYVYLDMSGIKQVEKRFPNIYRTCRESGIDITREQVPVSPAAHYIMGGIETGTYGETGVYALYSCGEAACTGVHGANRLASNSLLEGIVFGQRIVDRAEEIMYRRRISIDEVFRHFDQSWVYSPQEQRIDPPEAKNRLQSIMWEKVGIIRDEEGLKVANRELEAIYSHIAQGEDPFTYYEIVNMLTVARIIVQAALWRQESRGGHFRSDHPARDELRWLKHLSFINC